MSTKSVRNFMPIFINMILFMLLKVLKYSLILINIFYKAFLNVMIVKFGFVNFIYLSKEFSCK